MTTCLPLLQHSYRLGIFPAPNLADPYCPRSLLQVFLTSRSLLLLQGLSQSDDSFDVLEVGSQEQLQPEEQEAAGASSSAEGAELSSRPALRPAAGAGAVTVVDPFDRQFQPAMLASLDPPVLEVSVFHYASSWCSMLLHTAGGCIRQSSCKAVVADGCKTAGRLGTEYVCLARLLP